MAPGKSLHLPELFIGARNVRGGMDTFFVCSGFHQPYSPNWGADAKTCSAVRGWGRKGATPGMRMCCCAAGKGSFARPTRLLAVSASACALPSFIYLCCCEIQQALIMQATPQTHGAAWLAISGTRSDTMQILISGHVSWNAAGSKCSQTRSITGSFGRPRTKGGSKGPQPRHLRDASMRPG